MVVLNPLSLTLVEYAQDDVIGKLMAYISMLPHALIFLTIGIIIGRKSIIATLFFIGVILNEVINSMLKNWVQEPRVVIEGYTLQHYTKYGMPSNHAQFMFFYAALAIITMDKHRVETRKRRLIVYVCLIILAVLVNLSRVYLNYHNVQQVTYGSIIGVILALLYSKLINLSKYK